MLTKEEIKILQLFKEDLFTEYTIREIMKKLHKNSYNWVFNAVQELREQNILILRQRGKATFCSINLDNVVTLGYLSILEKFSISNKLPLKNIYELVNIIPLSYFTFIITGSYAEGKYTNKSDLDVVVIIEHTEDTKKVFSLLKNKGDLMIPKIHLYVFSKDEYLSMLLDKEENYGKFIFRNHIIFFGAENYYRIIKEAINNGFKG